MDDINILLIDDKEISSYGTGLYLYNNIDNILKKHITFSSSIVDFDDRKDQGIVLYSLELYDLVFIHSGILDTRLSDSRIERYLAEAVGLNAIIFSTNGKIDFQSRSTSRKHLFSVLESVLVLYHWTGWLNTDIFFKPNQEVQRPLINYMIKQLKSNKQDFLRCKYLSKWLSILNYDDIPRVLKHLESRSALEILSTLDEWKYEEVIWKL